MIVYKSLIKNLNVIREVSFSSLIWLIFIKLLQGVLPVASLMVLQKLINNVQNILIDGDQVFNMTILLIIAQFIITLMVSILNKTENYLGVHIQSNVELVLKSKVAEKIFRINFHEMEDFEFQNRVQRTQGDLGSRVFMPINQCLELISSLIVIFTVAIFLLQFHWLFVLLTFLTAVPLVIMHSKFGQDKYWLSRFQTPFAREQGYIYDMFIDRQHNKEIRLSQSSGYLLTKWKNVYLKNQKEILNQEASQHKKSIWMDVLNGLSYLLSGIYLVWMISQKLVKVGDFVSIIEAIQRLQGTVVTSAYLYSSIKENAMYLNDLDFLLDYEESPQENQFTFPEKMRAGIEFKDFSFKYPGNESDTLKNISLTIPTGSSLVIVGENGSGKSTLIKCLSNLYPIDKGSIYFDHMDINDISRPTLYSNLAVIPQDFVKYEFTLKENVLLGDVLNDHEDKFGHLVKKLNIDKISGKLRDGVHTRLGKMFNDSEDLSGGQWQKIALARTMLKDSQVLVLDEATSALDPESEIETFLSFRELSDQKTSIFISHRMYACHLADNIAVMKDGEIVEFGTFDHLMHKKEYFFTLYQKQAEMYEFKEGVEV